MTKKQTEVERDFCLQYLINKDKSRAWDVFMRLLDDRVAELESMEEHHRNTTEGCEAGRLVSEVRRLQSAAAKVFLEVSE